MFTTQHIFGFLAFLTIFSGMMTISSKNPVHSVLYLIVTFFSLSAHYIMLNAQFLAAVNIIVYAGAIMVLFLFVMMFLNLKEESAELKKTATIAAGVVIGVVLGITFWLVLQHMPTERVAANNTEFNSQVGMVETLGKVLYTDYLLPFELASVLFLVAMVGAVILGKREEGERHF